MNFALNAGRRRYENAPEYIWTHTGAGSNLIYVDPANELVIVCRWIRGAAFTEGGARGAGRDGEGAGGAG